MTETPAPTPDNGPAGTDETAPVVSEDSSASDTAQAPGDAPAPAPADAPDEDAATFKADTSGTDAPAVQAPVENAPASEAGNVTGVADVRPGDVDVSAAADTHSVSDGPKDSEGRDVWAMVSEIHRMVTDIHELVSEVAPAVESFVSELQTKGVGGLFASMLGNGRK